jgi:DNA mismatch repair protein MutS
MKDTPSMRQYKSMKEAYPDAIVFFRMGDFYETFDQDAYTASKVLDITLTSRDKGEDKTPMAGIPHHALMNYVPKLLQAGYKVAIGEQMEDPKTVKGIVKREVVRVITPGTAIESELQNPTTSLYSLAIYMNPKQLENKAQIGIAYGDLSQGSLTMYESENVSEIAEIIQNIHPSEIIYSENLQDKETQSKGTLFDLCKHYPHSVVPEYDFTHAEEYVKKHFGVTSLKGIARDGLTSGIYAAGALLKYIEDNEKSQVMHIEKLDELNFSHTMYLDPATIANLELFPQAIHEKGVVGSLLEVFDQCETNMGARKLRQVLLYPLLDKKSITQRLDSVDFFTSWKDLPTLREKLSRMSDIERINARISFLSPSPRDLLALRDSLQILLEIEQMMSSEKLPEYLTTLTSISTQFSKLSELIAYISKYISDDAGAILGNGNVINGGVDAHLDELKHLLSSGRGWIKEFQEKEIQRTGIHSLKVHYNKVFGYYIEISNAHKEKVPQEYIRKQTLVNGERYITPELKEKEDAIINAQDDIVAIEARIFLECQHHIQSFVTPIKHVAEMVAMIDLLATFARVALDNSYIKPTISDDSITRPIHITNGRHPVIEKNIGVHTYIPNDVDLDVTHNQILIITGPNMSGKSSILRMVALISLMMQIGSFVSAKKAELSIVDRIFSRVGARDNIAGGESTFMVEMHETANILNHATDKSLIILDEIGRGTSTYDGVSIAYAVIEYLHEFIGAKTMFATHYHELIDLERAYDRVKNFNVSVEEAKDTIVFLRKLVVGGTDKSYGIHVARIAGVPKQVVKRATYILAEYEHIKEEIKKADIPPLLSLIAEGDMIDNEPSDDHLEQLQEIRDRISSVDVENMTPLQALQLLQELHDTITKDD